MTQFNYATTAVEAAQVLQNEIKGKTVVITGVSPSSLGSETVRALASFAANIIIASRTKSKVDAVIETIRKEVPEFSPLFVPLDLASLESVREAANTIKSSGLAIDVLINNAAAPIRPALSRTKDGFEMQFGTNVLGHFLLTALLMPSILRGTNPRIVQISSLAEGFAPPRLDDPNYTARPEEYSQWPAYATTKSSNILFARELAKRFGGAGLRAYSLHPGAIRATNMGSEVSEEQFMEWGMLNKDGTFDPSVLKTLEAGTSTQVIAAFDPALNDQSGGYLINGAIANDQVTEHSRSEENGQKLWAVCEELVKQNLTPP